MFSLKYGYGRTYHIKSTIFVGYKAIFKEVASAIKQA
jgi:hypothetical protein